jgi:hypothetical protein
MSMENCAVIDHRTPAKERTFYLAAHGYHDAGTERENTKEGIICIPDASG